jgi:hypothetical protein
MAALAPEGISGTPDRGGQKIGPLEQRRRADVFLTFPS